MRTRSTSVLAMDARRELELGEEKRADSPAAMTPSSCSSALYTSCQVYVKLPAW